MVPIFNAELNESKYAEIEASQLRLLLQRMHGLITSELREKEIRLKKGSYFLTDGYKRRKGKC
jgi:hypothetical protein